MIKETWLPWVEGLLSWSGSYVAAVGGVFCSLIIKKSGITFVNKGNVAAVGGGAAELVRLVQI
jgi:hypothetical protein